MLVDEIKKTPSWTRTLLPPTLFCLGCVVVLLLFNFLVFHVIAELFAVLIGLMAMTVAATTSQFTRNYFTIFLAIGLGYCAWLDIIHVLVYKGMPFVDNTQLTLSTQFWLASRGMQTLTFLMAPLFLDRVVRIWQIHFFFASLTLVACGVIYFGYFPSTYKDGALTDFKVYAEIAIIGALLCAIWLYQRKKMQMGSALHCYLLISMMTMVFSEIMFTLYVDLYGIENIIGHLLKIYSYWYIYVALVYTTLRKPFSMMSRAASTYDAIPQPTLLIDQRGVIIQANQAAGEYVNKDVENLIGEKSHFYFHDKTLIQEECSVCQYIESGRSPKSMELSRGAEGWVECVLTPVDSAVVSHLWIEVVRDITIAKNLEIERSNLLRDLRERQKEQYCMFRVASLAADPHLSVTKLLEETVTLLPKGFVYPHLMQVEIDGDLGHFIAKSSEAPGESLIRVPIIVHEENGAYLNVSFIDGANGHEKIILDEERAMVGHIAKQLGDAITQYYAQRKIKKLSYLYELLSATNRAAMRCQSKEELLAALFDALLTLAGFDIIVMSQYQSKKVLHLHGVGVDDLSLLNQSLPQLMSSLEGQFETGYGALDRSIALSKKELGPWGRRLAQIGIRTAYDLVFSIEARPDIVVFLYAKEMGMAGEQQSHLLTQITEDASYALERFEIEARQKLAEQKAAFSEHRFSEVFMASPLPMLIISTPQTPLYHANSAFERWSGYDLREIENKALFPAAFLGLTAAETHQWWTKYCVGEDCLSAANNEQGVYHKNGTPLIARVIVMRLEDEIIIAWTDLTEIRQKQKLLEERETNLKNIIAQPFMGMYVRTQESFVYSNQRFRDIIGYSEKELEGKTLVDIAAVDDESRALILRKWKELQSSKSMISYKLKTKRRDGEPIILGLHGVHIEWNKKPAVLAIVEEITEIERAREQIEHYTNRLELAFKGTLQAISNMVEVRDPYTAGHEKRVGLIAKAIAKALGFDEKRCEAIELMGLVHDIGKISVPAEILTKPTRLTDLERQIVMQHSEAGYQILKDIDFDYPIAEVIREHHERIDGSGYPRGFKGDEILIEAKILAVADVLESMSSHRPYRPALGLEIAMKELADGRGQKYDVEVVDTLTRLIDSGELNMADLKGW